MGFMSAFVPSLLAGAATWTLRWSLIHEVRSVVALLVCGTAFLFIYVATAMTTHKSRTLILSGVAAGREIVHL